MKTVRLDQAAAMIPDGASAMVGGFMGVGTPECMIDEIVSQAKKSYGDRQRHCVAQRGIGKLVRAKLLGKAIVSHIGLSPAAQQQMMSGALEVDLVPQGTLIERIHALPVSVSPRPKPSS